MVTKKKATKKATKRSTVKRTTKATKKVPFLRRKYEKRHPDAS